MPSGRNVVIDISKGRGLGVAIYDKEGLKTDEVSLDVGNIQLIDPEYVVVSGHMLKDGILITARNVRDIKLCGTSDVLKK